MGTRGWILVSAALAAGLSMGTALGCDGDDDDSGGSTAQGGTGNQGGSGNQGGVGNQGGSGNQGGVGNQGGSGNQGGGTSGVPCTIPGDQCEPGETCRPSVDDTALECQEPGNVAVGSPCDDAGADPCVADASCVDLFEDGQPICMPLCTPQGSTLECGDGTTCVPYWSTLGVCLGDDCTPPDTGCPDGRRCGLFAGEVLACLPEGSAQPGDSCEVDDCAAGATCVAEGGLVCRQLCQLSADCTAESGTICVFPSEDLDWGYCSATAGECNAVTGAGCSANQGCYWSDPQAGTTICFDEGPLADGADCTSMVQLCQAGLDCFPDDPNDLPNTSYHCRAYCDGQHPCATGTCQSTSFIQGWQYCVP